MGGERNWDYRFCWVRDSAFTLYALSRLNYYDEAEAFVHFLMERVTQSDGDRSGLQIMYGMDGRAELTETELPQFAGYRGSKPVRVGNGAFDQRQMDIFGEFMDAVYIATRARGKPSYSVGPSCPASSTGSAPTGTCRIAASGKAAARTRNTCPRA